MNSKRSNESRPDLFKERWKDVFNNAGRYAADYISLGEGEVTIGLNGEERSSLDVRIDGIATAVANFDPIRVLNNVIKVLEETEEDVDKVELAAALCKTLTAWSEEWRPTTYPAHSRNIVN